LNNRYNQLEDEAASQDIHTAKIDLPENISGIYYDNRTDKLIALNSCLQTQTELACVLAEELGHYYTSCGNLLTDPSINNTVIRQQENRAKRWATKRLISIKSIIKAYEAGCCSIYEMAEYLEVTEEFLNSAFINYAAIYGKYKERGKYVIYFDPPGVLKRIKGR